MLEKGEGKENDEKVLTIEENKMKKETKVTTQMKEKQWWKEKSIAPTKEKKK